MLRTLTVLTVAFFAALPVRAAPIDELYRALDIPQMLDVMREEGLAYGEELAQDMFAGLGRDRWRAALDQIYDTDRMAAAVRPDFEAALDEADIPPLLAFFTSRDGRRILELELSARRAMIDDAVEDAARTRFRDLEEGDGDTATLRRIETFIEANDLIDANVEGALNASFQFYRGLVDGGAFDISEAEILADVWGQEEETRADTREWLFGYMLMAYGPLDEGVLDAYVALSASPEGRALNRALFAGFNRMYDEISYALGLAAAQQMRGQDL